jgi:ribulose-5-phosphate 4-epimerase/fuculose-1-phosphate aldolase
MSSAIEELIQDLVTANRILSFEGIVDAFGHVSARHPARPDRFLLSRARSPELVEPKDILEFTLEGEPIERTPEKMYLERFIHGALYEAKSEVQCVIHSHSRNVIPFGIAAEKLRPVLHSCAIIGEEVPVWDSQTSFGDTDLLISNMKMARDLAAVVGGGNCALMRGHGSTVTGRSIKEAVYTAIYLDVNADLQAKAMHLGGVKFLSPGEINAIKRRLGEGKFGEGYNRAWDYWRRRATERQV